MTSTAPLGFAIPTYRRPQLLDKALDSVVAQAAPLNAPVYVSDNSCDDHNVAVLQKWQARYPLIKHQINDRNLGIDGNVHQCIVHCPAEYVHVIGDDDLLLPGFAERVMTEVRKAPSHVICSYMYLANDFKPISGLGVIPREAAAGSLRILLPAYGWALGFIGAHVFRRSRFIAGDAEGFGSYFHHLLRLIQTVAPDDALGFVGEPLVGNRADDETTATWSGDRLAVVFGLEQALAAAMRDAYSPSEIGHAVEAARRNLGYTQFMRLLYWAAVAERSGHADTYWASLQRLVPAATYQRVRSVPRLLYDPLMRVIPVVRMAKRRLQRATA